MHFWGFTWMFYLLVNPSETSNSHIHMRDCLAVIPLQLDYFCICNLAAKFFDQDTELLLEGLLLGIFLFWGLDWMDEKTGIVWLLTSDHEKSFTDMVWSMILLSKRNPKSQWIRKCYSELTTSKIIVQYAQIRTVSSLPKKLHLLPSMAQTLTSCVPWLYKCTARSHK